MGKPTATLLHDHVRQRNTVWFPNGQLQATRNYAKGVVHGPFKSYYEDGSVQSVGSHSFGKRVGTWTQYDADGTIASVKTYDGGRP